MQSPDLMAKLSVQLIEDMNTQSARDIKKKMLEIITTKDNYKDTA